MIAEVDELLDETLTEIGTIEGNNRVDSVAYAEELDRKMKMREQELVERGNFQFHQVATNGGEDKASMFNHLDQREPGEKQIEFAIEEEAPDAEEKELDRD